APAWIVPPASPATPPAGAHVGAAAAADLATLSVSNLPALGVQHGPVSLDLAATRAGLAGRSGESAADARYLALKPLPLQVVGGPLAGTAYQHAPPSNAQPSTI